MRPRSVYNSKINIYLITFFFFFFFFISEDETALMMDELRMRYLHYKSMLMIKPYPSPFCPCLCCHFLASFRFRINTEKDRIGIYQSIVDQRIKVIYSCDVFNVLIIR